MSCPSAETLIELLDGELAAAAAADLRSHLAACDTCRTLVAAFASAVEPTSRASTQAEALSGAAAASGALPIRDDGTSGFALTEEALLEEMVGERFGRYEIRGRLGAGAMGVVLAGYDPMIERPVALKLLRNSAGGSQRDLAARLRREAMTLGRLSHPGIVPVYELAQANGRPYYTMKEVRGRTLARAIAQCTTLSERLKLLPRYVDLCHAVAYAHSEGVLHRDIKPANVMLGDHGETVVLDWGLSKRFGCDATEALGPTALMRDTASSRELPPNVVEASVGATVQGKAVGTPAYMSPEQAAGSRAIDARSDIWSLGAVLFELLTGRPPRAGSSAADWTRATHDPALLVPEIAPELASICRRALESDPDERYASAGEMAEDLEAFLVGGMVRAHAYGLLERGIKTAARHRKILAGTAAALACLLALAVYSIARISGERQQAIVNLAEGYAEGAARALARGDVAESRAKTRMSLELADSAEARSLWRELAHERLWWSKTVAGTPFGVAFSPEDRLLAVSDTKGAIYLVDRDTARARVIEGTTGACRQIRGLGFAGAERLVSSGCDRFVRLWDVASAHQVRAFGPFVRAPYSLAVSPRGDVAALVTVGIGAQLLDLGTGVVTDLVKDVRSEAGAAAFSPDGRRLAYGGLGTGVQIFDLATKQLVTTLAASSTIQAISFSPRGGLLAAGGERTGAMVWRSTDFAPAISVAGDDSVICSIDISPDGRLLATRGRDTGARLWEIESGKVVAALTTAHDERSRILFSPDGLFVATNELNNQKVSLWRVSPRPDERPRRGGQAGDPAISYGGDIIASAGADGVTIWNVADGTTAAHVGPEDDNTIISVAFSPDDTLVAAAGTDGHVYLYTAPALAPAGRLRGHDGYVWDLAFSPDSASLASVGDDGLLRVYDVSAHRERLALPSGRFLRAVAWVDGGSTIAAAGYEGVISLWRARDGALVRRLTDHELLIKGLATGPTGVGLVSGGQDRKLRVWDLGAGKARILTTDQTIISVAYSPDTQRVAASFFNDTVQIWDLASGRVTSCDTSSEGQQDVTFSTDGARLVTIGQYGSQRLADASTCEPIWRTRAVVWDAQQPLRLTHRGWIDPTGNHATPGGESSAWRTAVEGSRLTISSPNGLMLCCLTADELQLWDRSRDELLATTPADGRVVVRAHDAGCLAMSGGRAFLLAHSGTRVLADANVQAIGLESDTAIVATNDAVTLWPVNHEAEQPRAVSVSGAGLTAVGLTHEWLVMAHAAVGMSMVRLDDPGIVVSPSLAEIPAAPVVAILAGPQESLFLGFADGTVGTWRPRTNARIDRLSLNGPILYLGWRGDRLFAVSELGDGGVLDLEPQLEPYCRLMSRVWQEFPAVWRDGGLVREPRPTKHACQEGD